MDIFRKVIESMYCGVCDVIEYRKSQNPTTKKMEFSEVTVLLGQPCKLSFKSIPTTGDGIAASTQQEVKIFLSPDITIKEGSKINVTQNGVMNSYKNSGTPALYKTHQEITLKLFDGWA